jgi:hypothetical protein
MGVNEMGSGIRIRLAAAVAALSVLVVGVSVAAAGPSAAAGQDTSTTTTHAQPPLSKESAAVAARALAQSGTRVSPNVVPQAVSAVINSDGTLCGGQGFGVVSASHIATGTYEVFFNQTITSGVYVATIGLCGSVGASAPGQITVVGRVGTTNGLFIQTYNSAGVPADLSFHVVAAF